jgi:hypothetical protein
MVELTKETMRKAGARIARTGNPMTSESTLETYISNLATDLQEAARAGYRGEIGRNTPSVRL